VAQHAPDDVSHSNWQKLQAIEGAEELGHRICQSLISGVIRASQAGEGLTLEIAHSASVADSDQPVLLSALNGIYR